MRQTVSTWHEFGRRWDGVTNFLMAGECAAPFDFPMPPLADLVDIVRNDDQARVNPGAKGERVDLSDIRETFRKLPIEQALRYEFRMSHFQARKWDAPGGFLHGFGRRVLEPLQDALRAQGFTWDPDGFGYYFFFSGPHCATNYHMDKSNVLAWQLHGTKVFAGLNDPDRWEPLEQRVTSSVPTCRRPAGIEDADVLAYEMRPGSVLWNCLLTPHWVEAVSEPACSLNFSWFGLRRHGKLCRHEEELLAWQARQQQVTPSAATP